MPNLKPYAKVKFSGVSSLGDVPKHWNIVQLGRIGRFFKGRGGTKEDDAISGVPCIRYGDLYTQHQFHIKKSQTYIKKKRRSAYTSIYFGDVLFAGSGETIEEIGKSAVNLMPQPGYCGGDIILFRSSIEINARFLGYATDCSQSANQKSCMGRGITVMHIYSHDLKYMFIALPPLPEQNSIVRYLDYINFRMQKFILSKQKLIDVLNELRKIVTHRAVTRGLNPSVLMKPSGAEWLGEIPAHWETFRLKTYAKDIVEQTNLHESGRVYIALEHVESWTGKIQGVEEDATFESSVKKFQPQDILFGKLAPHLAKVARVREYGVCVGEFLVLRSKSKKLSAAYLEHLMRSKPTIDAINAATFGATRPRADWHFIGQMTQPLPPLPEQIAITKHLEKTTAAIDIAITQEQRKIELMSEYRTRLIADVVTGKLDVRDAVTQLPDETYDDEDNVINEDESLADELNALQKKV